MYQFTVTPRQEHIIPYPAMLIMNTTSHIPVVTPATTLDTEATTIMTGNTEWTMYATFPLEIYPCLK